MDVQFNVQGHFSGKGAETLIANARRSFKDFFRGTEIGSASVLVFRCGRGSDPQRLIKVDTTAANVRKEKVPGVPVVICTDGTQGIFGNITVAGLSDSETQALIENGPYLRRSKKKLADTTPMTETSAVVPVVTAPPLPVAPTGPAQPHRSASNRQAPLQKLLANGTETDEIERLKQTLASIIYRQIGDSEMPSTLLVPIEGITTAIMEHMRLPRNASGSYKGIIGNFYNARIAMFALKWDDASGDSVYTDWLFDLTLVLDFVGGKDNLAALTRVRDTEVHERTMQEEAIAANPPPKAEQVAEAAGFLADASLLELAAKTIAGKRAAEEEAHLAEVNAAKLSEEIVALDAKIAHAKTALESANALVATAKEKVSEYVLPPEAMEKIRAAKARIDALVQDLGI